MKFVRRPDSQAAARDLRASVIPLAVALAAPSLPSPAEAQSLEEFHASVDETVEAATAEQSARPGGASLPVEPDRTVVIIPCGMAAEGCARAARGTEEAAAVLGWETVLIDPAGDPSKMANAVLQAINLGADAIALQAIDAGTVLGPLTEAKKAGIAVVAFAGIDQDGVLDATIPSEESFVDDGYNIAAAAYRMAGDRLNIIQMRADEFGVIVNRATGTEKFIEECRAAGGECSILAAENFLVSNLTTQVPQQAVGQLRRNPDFDVLWVGYDAGLNFMIQGLEAAGLTDEGFAVSFDANVANLDIIREDGFEKATSGLPLEWVGWAEVDALNRLFQGEEPTDGNVRSKVLVRENLPDAGAWEGDVDFRAAYRELWNVQ